MNNKQQYLDIAAGNGEKEASMMVAIPASELTSLQLEQRLEEQTYFTEGEIDYLPDEEGGGFFFSCKRGEEELRFYVSLVESDPEYTINPYFATDPISQELYAQASNAPQAVVVECLFQEKPLVSYLQQLKIIQILVPDLLLGLDISAAGKVFTREWLNFQLIDDLMPSIDSLYVVHAIYDHDENSEDSAPTKYWFHTHGLARCGLSEAEIIIPHPIASYYGIPELFWSFVNNSITNGKIDFNEPIFIGQTQTGYEYLVAVPFEEGLLHVGTSTPIDNLKPLEEMNFEFGDMSSERFMGDWHDRDESHQHPSVMLFRVTQENPTLESFFEGFEDQNAMMFMRTDEETADMSSKARLRWEYFTHMLDNYGPKPVAPKKGLFAKLLGKSEEEEESEWRFLIKCGISYQDEEGDEGHEHMWFEPLTWNGDQFEGRLINHPFYVETMEEGGVYPLTRDHITDWTIYYQDGNYTPDTIYKLLSGAQVH